MTERYNIMLYDSFIVTAESPKISLRYFLNIVTLDYPKAVLDNKGFIAFFIYYFIIGLILL